MKRLLIAAASLLPGYGIVAWVLTLPVAVMVSLDASVASMISRT